MDIYDLTQQAPTDKLIDALHLAVGGLKSMQFERAFHGQDIRPDIAETIRTLDRFLEEAGHAPQPPTIAGRYLFKAPEPAPVDRYEEAIARIHAERTRKALRVFNSGLTIVGGTDYE